MSWTDQRVATLTKMWTGGSSAAEIAKTLGEGTTRNAVIGKAHRMGLSGRPSPIKKKAGAKTATKKTKATVKVKNTAKSKIKKSVKVTKTKTKLAKKAAPIQIETEVAPAPRRNLKGKVAPTMIAIDTPPEDGGVALIDLASSMCKWPFGDPQEDDFTFCGLEIHPGTPYCPEHAIMAYQKSSKSRAAAKAKEAAAAEEEAEDEEDEDLDSDIDDEEVDEDKLGTVD